MARKRSKRGSGRKSSGFGLFALGLLVGGISTGLFLGVIKDRPSDIGAGIDSLIDLAVNRDDATDPQSTTNESKTDPQPKLQFSYHEFLLEDEYVLPQTITPEPQTQTAKAPQPEETKNQPEPATDSTSVPESSKYVLQVGSFNKFEDADAVKAKLALSGQQAFIQKVTVEGRGEFFRVRLGPFDQLQALSETSAFLEGIGYPSIRFRIKN